MRPQAMALIGGVGVAAVAVLALVALRAQKPEEARCGGGLVVRGSRCCVDADARAPCTTRAPEPRAVRIPDTTLLVGPSDWEAEGRVRPRTVSTRAYWLDAYELTAEGADPGRAASSLTADEARAACARRGGRLPTEDEWMAAAAGATGTRYPWGDTGAVCRRAAWGLLHGPCGEGADGPDTAGAHPDGDSPLGLHDLAGNVAEWVETPQGPVAKGGSWATPMAADLRIWAKLEVDPKAKDPRVGARCAYAEAPRGLLR